jgi:hypothetical protein
MAEASFIIRAIDATRQAFGEIQNSLAKLKSSSATAAAFMKRVFDPRALGAGLAAAFGISLVGAIDKAAEAVGRIITQFEDVKRIVRETAEQVQQVYANAAFALLRPEQQLIDLANRRRELESEILALRQKVTPRVVEFQAPLPEGLGFARQQKEVIDATVEEAAALAKKELALAEISRMEGEIRTKVLDQSKTDRLKGVQQLDESLAKLKEQQSSATDADKKAGEERIKMLNEMASAQLDLLEPMREYQRQIETVNMLEWEEKLTAEQAAARREQIRLEASAGINREIELLREAADAQRDILDPARAYQREIEFINKLLAKSLLTPEEAAERLRQINLKIAESSGAIVDQQVEITSEMQRMQDLARDVGDTIAGGFEDAIFSGEKLSEVLKRLALDLMRLLFQRMVTQQLAAGISTMLGFPPIPGFRANGGPVNSNAPYIVGERGPELFVPGTSGAIIPNNRMGSGGGGGGPTVNISYNIQSGVSRAELQPILEQERKRLRAEIPDMVRRGGSYRAAFA